MAFLPFSPAAFKIPSSDPKIPIILCRLRTLSCCRREIQKAFTKYLSSEAWHVN